MKILFCMLALLCPALNGFCQQKPLYYPLAIGDTIPTLPQPEWNEKAVILDFFATWCQPCIRKMPELDSLQQVYGEQLAIVTITHESAETIHRFRAQNKTFRNTRLPVITSDSVWRLRFPHREIPHTVWIYKGIVKAITWSHAIKPAHLDAFVAGRTINLPEKKDQMEFDRHLPLLDNGNGGDLGDCAMRCQLTRYLPGVSTGGGRGLLFDSTMRRIYYFNHDLPMLFTLAAGLSPAKTTPRIIAKDPTRYQMPAGTPYNEWAPGGAFCIELIVPATTPPNVCRRMMLETLNLFSPLTATINGNQLILTEKK